MREGGEREKGEGIEEGKEKGRERMKVGRKGGKGGKEEEEVGDRG